jgi:hypothetical protein
MANSTLDLAVKQVLASASETTPNREEIPKHWNPWATSGVRGTLQMVEFYPGKAPMARVMMEDSELLHIVSWEGKQMPFWEVLADIALQRYLVRRKEILSVLSFLSPTEIKNLETVNQKFVWSELEKLIPNIPNYKSKKYADVLLPEDDLRKAIDWKISAEQIDWMLGAYTPTTIEHYRTKGCPIDNRFGAVLQRTYMGRFPVQVPRHNELSPLPQIGEEIYIMPVQVTIGSVTDASQKPRTIWETAKNLSADLGSSPLHLYPALSSVF